MNVNILCAWYFPEQKKKKNTSNPNSANNLVPNPSHVASFILIQQGKVLSDHPPIKFVISISGSKFRDPNICDVAYKEPIKVKSAHLIGDKDWLKIPSEELATAFDNPLILRHPQGHTVPRLGLKFPA